MNIAILGAGSIGCYLGAYLVSNAQNVQLIGRSRIKKQLQEFGLNLTNWQGNEISLTFSQLSFYENPSKLADADYILVTVKSGDTRQAANTILENAKTTAIIVSFQNGVRNVDVLQSLLPNFTIVKAMVPFNVYNDTKGNFHCGTEGNLAIETQDARLNPLIQMFCEAGLEISQHKDLSAIQWGKLIMNLNNAVNALSGLPLLAQLNNRAYRKIMSQVISEALSVLQVAEIYPARSGKVIPKLMPYILDLPDFLFKIVARSTLQIDPKARSSMYEDLSLKRKTEIDYLNNEIVKLAEQYGLVAPVNLAIVKLIQKAENAAVGSPQMGADQIQAAIIEQIIKSRL